jgi:hypothetical protein
MIFVFFALFELFSLLYLKGGTQSVWAIIMFLLIAVIISYFRSFLVFVFYFIVIGMVVAMSMMIIIFLFFGLTINNIGKMSGEEFMFWAIGSLVLIIGISGYLTKRTRDKEVGREAEYDRPPNHDSYSDADFEQAKEEAYERGKAEAGVDAEKEENIDWAYSLLGADKDASNEQVKKAYRETSKEVHPDRTHTKTSGVMQNVNEAYDKIKKQRGMV